jgi:predicted metalloprotease with PDZ domain
VSDHDDDRTDKLQREYRRNDCKMHDMPLLGAVGPAECSLEDLHGQRECTCSATSGLRLLLLLTLLLSCDSQPAVEWRKYERKIGVPGGPLGFTLAKANSGYAEVSRIIPGGAAERANVIVGSLLIGLNSLKNLKFDEIVDMLRTEPRPMLFHFVFRSQMSPEGPKAAISSVPEPRTVEINVTLHDKQELGCSLSATEFYCVVRSVDEDCLARRHGVLVGSRVVAVNGRKFLKPRDLIREICTAQRPIKITVHRVEGLMRGWSS